MNRIALRMRQCWLTLFCIFVGMNIKHGHANPQQLELRDSALTPKAGSWSIGVFNPLKLQLADAWGIELHPLAFFMNPHIRVTQQWWTQEHHVLSGVYGLSLPSLALNKSLPFGVSGYLAPSCLVNEVEPERGGCQRGGWGLSPVFGFQYGLQKDTRVWSVYFDAALGIMLTGKRPLPLESHPPIEMIFAPLSNTYRIHTGARMSQRLTSYLSTSIELNFWWIGASDIRVSETAKSPWTLSSHVGFDYAFGSHLSATLGLIYWNSDQRAMIYEKIDDLYQKKTYVRSHDFWPTFDLIWSY